MEDNGVESMKNLAARHDGHQLRSIHLGCLQAPINRRGAA